MEILTPPRPDCYREKEIESPNQSPKPPSNVGRLLFFAAVLVILAVVFDDFVQKTPNGKYELKPERKEELERRKKKVHNAEQYALLAKVNGWYPCYNCGDEKQIFLYAGEVWKYGISVNGKRRYKVWEYEKYKLEYIRQYTGTVTDCLVMEIEKIFKYPLLPENLKRAYKLPRPPGNKEDY